jgi:hypothetical protein
MVAVVAIRGVTAVDAAQPAVIHTATHVSTDAVAPAVVSVADNAEEATNAAAAVCVAGNAAAAAPWKVVVPVAAAACSNVIAVTTVDRATGRANMIVRPVIRPTGAAMDMVIRTAT